MRAKSLILGAVAVLVAVLLGPVSPAHAFPESTLECNSASNRINCEVTIAQFRGIPGQDYDIDWEGGSGAYLDRNKKNRSFRCSVLGNVFSSRIVSVTITPRPFTGSSFTFFRVVPCEGAVFGSVRELFSIACKPSLTALAGVPYGNYIVCDTLWANDGSAATVQWVVTRGPQPVVNTDAAERWTEASFDCNNPGGTELTFTAYVRVTDASGAMTTPATIPCGW